MYTHTMTIQVQKFDTSKKRDMKALETLACDDDWFNNSFSCPTVMLTKQFSPTDIPNSYVFVAIDSKPNTKKEIVGYITIVEHRRLRLWNLTLAASRAFTNASFKGIGSKMMDGVLKDAAKSKTVDFVLIQGYSPSGLGLYKKFGFMSYGPEGTLVRPVGTRQKILHPNTYRAWNLEWMTYFNQYTAAHGGRKDKVSYRKSQDTEDFRKRFFGTSPTDKNTPSMIVPESMIKEIRQYPDWAYAHSPKSAWPF